MVPPVYRYLNCTPAPLGFSTPSQVPDEGLSSMVPASVTIPPSERLRGGVPKAMQASAHEKNSPPRRRFSS